MQCEAKASILVVEDRFIVAEDLANNLRKLGYEVPETVMSGEEAVERATILQPDLVLMDIHLKGEIDGIEAARQIKKRTGLSVVYLTAHSDDGTLQRASETDPLGYLVKPFEERQLYITIELALNRQRAERQKNAESAISSESSQDSSDSPLARELPAVRNRPEFVHIVGKNQSLLALLERIELVAKTDVTVHISGENGTGKELVADAVHRVSSRSAKPFVKLNCSAIPAALLESALFGHIKGSFTGAVKDQQGFVEHAEGGTLFLDEIGDLSLDIQVKLLRMLQSREYSRVGEAAIRTADIRIITATNRHLKDLVKEGKIREDFYYRINVFPLNVPPLRDRHSDIPLLADYFRTLFDKTFEKNVGGFTSEAIAALISHQWPGNIRELENAIRHAFVVVPDGGIIDKNHLPPDVLESLSDDEVSSAPDLERGERLHVGQDEKEEILKALEAAAGNKTRAAKMLGYSRVTLWKKMARLGIEDEGEQQEEAL